AGSVLVAVPDQQCTATRNLAQSALTCLRSASRCTASGTQAEYVSRAQRSSLGPRAARARGWCAADPGPPEARCWLLAGSVLVAVPDQQCTATRDLAQSG